MQVTKGMRIEYRDNGPAMTGVVLGVEATRFGSHANVRWTHPELGTWEDTVPLNSIESGHYRVLLALV
ncbi:hypothetical protein [Sandaracinus amylolyticus]|uniref:hypothetical protein n=1 Tax=Sandaracinus amylolyticus TaxID=927083 RepID=UPI001F265AAB|nr:hypothetical protein [Sandaracinus amylolyticus]UJR78908.1 Hypothetical protein I5071_9410 [Sandaracinus amylolyticus]